MMILIIGLIYKLPDNKGKKKATIHILIIIKRCSFLKDQVPIEYID